MAKVKVLVPIAFVELLRSNIERNNSGELTEDNSEERTYQDCQGAMSKHLQSLQPP